MCETQTLPDLIISNLCGIQGGVYGSPSSVVSGRAVSPLCTLISGENYRCVCILTGPELSS